MNYESDHDYRQALEERLKNRNKETGAPFVRLRKRLVFERCMVRLQKKPHSPWVLKQILYYKIAPAIDVGLASGKLNQYEYDYTIKFIRKIMHLKSLYQGVKKREFDLEKDEPLIPSKTYLASNKVIDNAIKNLIKAGMDPETAKAIRAKSYNRQEVKCINPHCNKMFVPKNENNNHCQDCSQPDKYLKEWRASQADKKSRKSEPAPPPPEKIIYMRFINPDVFD